MAHKKEFVLCHWLMFLWYPSNRLLNLVTLANGFMVHICFSANDVKPLTFPYYVLPIISCRLLVSIIFMKMALQKLISFLLFVGKDINLYGILAFLVLKT